MQGTWLAVGILAVWRLTHLVQAEDGPWDLVLRLRRRLGDGFLGRLLDCFHCTSLWVALPFAVALGDSLLERFVLWPALSGGAMLAQRLSARRSGEAEPRFEPTPVFYQEGQPTAPAPVRDAVSRVGSEPAGSEPATGSKPATGSEPGLGSWPAAQDGRQRGPEGRRGAGPPEEAAPDTISHDRTVRNEQDSPDRAVRNEQDSPDRAVHNDHEWVVREVGNVVLW